jgi:hypothetical protein
VADSGPARDVPKEALRRFRADVKANRERRARERAEHVRLRDERWTTMIAWIDEHGTPDQKSRFVARLLPPAEIKEAMTDDAFRALSHLIRYTHDGPERLRAHVEQWLGRTRQDVSERDYVVFGHQVRTITDRQWAVLHELKGAVPDAHVGLHLREFVWRRDPGVPRISQLTAVVTRKIGAVVLRREYLVSDDADGPSSAASNKESA